MADRQTGLSFVDSSQTKHVGSHTIVLQDDREKDATSKTLAVNQNGALNRLDPFGESNSTSFESGAHLNQNKTECESSGSRYLPRLVFLDSDEALTENLDNGQTRQVHVDEQIGRQERAVSDSAVIQGYSNPNHLNFQRSDSSGGNSFYRNRRHKVSQVSLQSSDSELLLDHTVVTENTGVAADEDFEQFIMEYPIQHPRLKTWHCHAIGQKLPDDNVARNQLIAVSILSVLFMVGESIGGIISNSLALFTDVLHLGSDLISFLISLLAIYLSKKPATRSMTFGYHRTEVLGALFSVFIIWMVTGILIYMAIERIQHEHYKNVKADEMLVTAVIGVVFNIVMGFVLHSEVCFRSSKGISLFGHGHSHGGGHSHSHGATSHNSRSVHHTDEGSTYQRLQSDEESTESIEEEGQTNVDDKKQHPKNINVRAAFIHVVGDILQSLGVLIAAIIIKLKPEEKYRLADPICTFLFSILVILTTITVLRDTLRIIMEGVPRDIEYYKVKSSLQKLGGVKAVHGLTIWSLTVEKNALAVHLVVDPVANPKLVLCEATEMLKKDFNFLQTTIQVEDHIPELMSKCESCVEIRK